MSSSNRNAVYAGFDFHALAFVTEQGRPCRTIRELGRMMADITAALERGDVEFLRQFSFIGRLYRPRVPRTRITPAVRRHVIARDEGKCRQCGATERLEVDHIIPVVWGGSDDLDNLQALCRSCNHKKGPKPHAPRPVEVRCA